MLIIYYLLRMCANKFRVTNKLESPYFENAITPYVQQNTLHWKPINNVLFGTRCIVLVV